MKLLRNKNGLKRYVAAQTLHETDNFSPNTSVGFDHVKQAGTVTLPISTIYDEYSYEMKLTIAETNELINALQRAVIMSDEIKNRK